MEVRIIFYVTLKNPLLCYGENLMVIPLPFQSNLQLKMLSKEKLVVALN